MSRGEEWSGVVQKALLKSEWDAEHPPMNLPEESVPDCVCVCVVLLSLLLFWFLQTGSPYVALAALELPM